jgi:hypothetical protein
MLSEKLAGKIQRLMDEYLGSVGSAALVDRGQTLFCSSYDDSACGLLPAFDEVPRDVIVDEPRVVNLPIARDWCTYAVALDDDHVLFVIAARAVAPGAIATRMKKAAALLRRVIASSNAAPPVNPSGASGAPALVGLKSAN